MGVFDLKNAKNLYRHTSYSNLWLYVLQDTCVLTVFLHRSFKIKNVFWGVLLYNTHFGFLFETFYQGTFSFYKNLALVLQGGLMQNRKSKLHKVSFLAQYLSLSMKNNSFCTEEKKVGIVDMLLEFQTIILVVSGIQES